MSQATLPDNETLQHRVNYWDKKVQGINPLQLPTDFPKQKNKDNIIRGRIEFRFGCGIREQLNELCRAQGIELVTVLFALFDVLLYRYTSQEDVVVGNVLPALDGGDSFLTLPVTIFLNGSQLFTNVLQEVSTILKQALLHANMELHGHGSNAEAEISLLNVLFAYRNQGLFNSDAFSHQTSQADLILMVEEGADDLLCVFDYNALMFSESTIKSMSAHYGQLLKSAIAESGSSIGVLPILTEDEQNDILYKFNDTLIPYSSEKTLVDLFEEQVSRTPDAIALRQHELMMTYREVNEKANLLAHRLAKNDVKPGDNVGLIATRGFSMIIGMYGIMKAGGAYVPIDPEYPLDRQEYILTNSFVTKAVADGDYPLAESDLGIQFIKIEDAGDEPAYKENLNLKVDSKQLAYTIYTSGSTGRPKGVMIEHHSAVNLVEWVNRQFSIDADDRLLFITSMCFDLSVYDIFGILAAGGSAVIVKQDELMDVSLLSDMLQKYRITFWDSVPTTMDYLVRELETQNNGYVQNELRTVFLSGDWIPVNLPGRIKKFFPAANVISLGGATECTVWSNFYPVENTEENRNSIPYGRPIANNFFYILNEQLQPAPVGVAGELYIGGVGVARGYANDPEKTAYSFVKDPFSSQAGGMMYRTGDLGRMLPDMNMEFIGRRDDQVKIRGFRIELGEIESVLKQGEFVRDAVVLARNDQEGKKRLIGYIVPKTGYDRDAVISQMKAKLPDYMVPSLWIELDRLPLTSNGKIDKKALPDFEANEKQKGGYKAPETSTEKLLAAIWEQVLKLKDIGTEDNFFDIGGHSLLAVQIMTRIEKKTGKKFPIAALFTHPTIASLSTLLQEKKQEYHWRSLIPIKAEGNKTPVYLVHGVGLNILNFKDIALHVANEQPVFGLQGIGLDGKEASIDNLEHIASYYVNEILKHNPDGPYAIAGYSIGGFIAVEMVRQLQALNKQVKMLGIFDTDAENARKTEKWYIILPKVFKRYLPKFMGGKKSMRKQLAYKVRTQAVVIGDKIGLSPRPESREYYNLLNKTIHQYFIALNKYELTPIDVDIYLFKAKINVHYNDDEEYLGWKNYTSKDVKIIEVPGDHLSMLKSPHASVFGLALQKTLDNC